MDLIDRRLGIIRHSVLTVAAIAFTGYGASSALAGASVQVDLSAKNVTTTTGYISDIFSNLIPTGIKSLIPQSRRSSTERQQ